MHGFRLYLQALGAAVLALVLLTLVREVLLTADLRAAARDLLNTSHYRAQRVPAHMVVLPDIAIPDLPFWAVSEPPTQVADVQTPPLNLATPSLEAGRVEAPAASAGQSPATSPGSQPPAQSNRAPAQSGGSLLSSDFDRFSSTTRQAPSRSPQPNPSRPARRRTPPPPKGWNKMPQYPPAQVRQQRALASSHPIPPTPAHPKIGILTCYEGEMSPFFKACLYSKRCYAELHNITLILDTTEYKQAHRRHPVWNRIPALQKHLPHFDWLLYLDADIAMANTSIQLMEFVGRFRPDSYIVWTEARDGVNTGGFFIRNVPWSYWWLEKWWAFSKEIPDMAWNDQLAVWDAIVHHFSTNGSAVPLPLYGPQPCMSTPLLDGMWQTSMKCFSSEMDYMGFPLHHRDAFHHEFWPQSRKPRGFTFFFMEPRTLWLWPPEELFMPGDFVIHTHSGEVVLNVTDYATMARTKCWGRLPTPGPVPR